MSASRFLYRIVQASSSGITTATSAIPAHCTPGSKSCAAPVSAEDSERVQPSSSDVSSTTDCDKAVTSPSAEGVSNEGSSQSGKEEEPPSKRPKLEECSSDNPDCDASSAAAEAVAKNGKNGAKETEQTHRIKGVIFDMDGTLTVPVLNFVEIRRELKIPVGADILPTVFSLPPAEKEEAMNIIDKWEEDGARKLQLQPGTMDLLEYVAESKVHRALMTRNSMTQTQVFLDRIQQQLSEHPEKYPYLSKEAVFEEVVTRDFRPVKPDPAAVLHICKCCSLEPWQVAVVGDDKTDMICGKRAGVAFTVLLRNERNKDQERHEDFAVDSLTEVISLFSSPIAVVRDNQEQQN